MKIASEKQIVFANKIAYLLNIDTPRENTAQAYFLFIQEHIEEFQEKQKIAMREYRLKRSEELKQRTKSYMRSEIDDMHDSAWVAAMDFSWM